MLISTTTSAQYSINKFEVLSKGSWDLKYKIEYSFKVQHLRVLFFNNQMAIENDTFNLDLNTKYIKYEDKKYISTSYQAINNKSIPCRIILFPTLVEIIYNDNGNILKFNYYLQQQIKHGTIFSSKSTIHHRGQQRQSKKTKRTVPSRRNVSN
jgi:hypothetical protein